MTPEERIIKNQEILAKGIVQLLKLCNREIPVKYIGLKKRNRMIIDEIEDRFSI